MSASRLANALCFSCSAALSGRDNSTWAGLTWDSELCDICNPRVQQPRRGRRLYSTAGCNNNNNHNNAERARRWSPSQARTPAEESYDADAEDEDGEMAYSTADGLASNNTQSRAALAAAARHLAIRVPRPEEDLYYSVDEEVEFDGEVYEIRLDQQQQQQQHDLPVRPDTPLPWQAAGHTIAFLPTKGSEVVYVPAPLAAAEDDDDDDDDDLFDSGSASMSMSESSGDTLIAAAAEPGRAYQPGQFSLPHLGEVYQVSSTLPGALRVSTSVTNDGLGGRNAASPLYLTEQPRSAVALSPFARGFFPARSSVVTDDAEDWTGDEEFVPTLFDRDDHGTWMSMLASHPNSI